MFQPNGISLRVEDHGSGKLVVLLHGCSPLSRCVTDADELREHARRRLADLKSAGQNRVPAELAERRHREDTRARTEIASVTWFTLRSKPSSAQPGIKLEMKPCHLGYICSSSRCGLLLIYAGLGTHIHTVLAKVRYRNSWRSYGIC